jgi:acetate---CoA ligase (ADP-forming)
MEDRKSADESYDEESYLQLRDFTPVIVHRVRTRDRSDVIDFVRHLTRESIELRFWTPMLEERVIEEVLGVRDPVGRVSLVMETIGLLPRIVGSAEYVRYPHDPGRAEVAFLVEDDFQGRGAGTLLLNELARRARAEGIRRFTAIVSPENLAMRDVFLNSGYPYSVVCDGSQWLVELDIGEATGVAEPPTRSRWGEIAP